MGVRIFPYLPRYLRIWLRSAVSNFSIISTTRTDFISFVAGKLLRFVFPLIFFSTFFLHVPTIAGYKEGEVLLVFAGMNLIDVIVQLVWFRGLTDLQRMIRLGEFDMTLTKPMSPLFWAAFRIFDFIDLTTLPVAIWMLLYATQRLETPLLLSQWVLGGGLFLLSLLLAFAINLTLAALNFWTTEVGNAWWLYRDTVYMSRFPPDIFPLWLKNGLIYLIPVFVITVFPALAMLGRLSTFLLAWGIGISLTWFIGSLLFWRHALRHYTSASS